MTSNPGIATITKMHPVAQNTTTSTSQNGTGEACKGHQIIAFFKRPASPSTSEQQIEGLRQTITQLETKKGKISQKLQQELQKSTNIAALIKLWEIQLVSIPTMTPLVCKSIDVARAYAVKRREGDLQNSNTVLEKHALHIHELNQEIRTEQGKMTRLQIKTCPHSLIERKEEKRKILQQLEGLERRLYTLNEENASQGTLDNASIIKNLLQEKQEIIQQKLPYANELIESALFDIYDRTATESKIQFISMTEFEQHDLSAVLKRGDNRAITFIAGIFSSLIYKQRAVPTNEQLIEGLNEKILHLSAEKTRIEEALLNIQQECIMNAKNKALENVAQVPRTLSPYILEEVNADVSYYTEIYIQRALLQLQRNPKYRAVLEKAVLRFTKIDQERYAAEAQRHSLEEISRRFLES